MTKSIFWLLNILIFSTVSGQINNGDSIFHLTGTLSENRIGTVFLNYRNASGFLVTDSCHLHNGKFSFIGTVSEPTNADLTFNSRMLSEGDSNYLPIWIEPKKMNLSSNGNCFKDIHVKGSKTQDELESLRTLLLLNSSSAGNGLHYEEIIKQFASEHPDSYIIPLQLWAPINLPIDTINMVYKLLNASVRQSYFGKKLERKILKSLSSAEGKPATDFITSDLHGNVIKLSDFKGKYLLLDFWASWCVPCRTTMPELIELYRQYHEQGLEIVAVSVDENQQSWKKAIEEDGTGIWHHVLSNGGNENQPQIHQQYAVSVYPTKILINPEGIIVGRFYDTDSDANCFRMIQTLLKNNK